MSDYPGAGKPTLRVRTGRNYPIPFNVDHGQRNAEFVKAPLTPLYRLWKKAVAFSFVRASDCDLIHSINAVPIFTKKPYVITYEDYLPYTPPDMYSPGLERMLQRHLLSDKCMRIIAMSEYALAHFRRQCEKMSGAAHAIDKAEVVYPAKDVVAAAPKKHSDGLRLAFVGADFLRKGGPALVRAHEMLRKQGVPLETTIVSSLRWSENDYVGPSSKYDIQGEYSRLSQEGIQHLSAVPNAEVMQVLSNADYFVFPTFHDTFGYAPVEALGCGTPVIATDTAAQPEIVENGVSGFLLPFRNNAMRQWEWLYKKREPRYDEAYAETIESLATGIYERLLQLYENRKDYEAMSAAALERARTKFGKERARNRLEEIYELCRGK